MCGVVAAIPGTGCNGGTSSRDATEHDASTAVQDAAARLDALPSAVADAMPPNAYCALPGSVVSTDQGVASVAGGTDPAKLKDWLTIPPGFCAHYFANVPETRQLRFSPSGDLFVASPSRMCTGGASGGWGKIVVLPDDDHNGLGDSVVTFLDQLPSTQGMTFARGYFYFQDDVNIKRVAFASGDRMPSASVEAVTTITAPQADEHWPKVLDMDKSGNLFISNGSSQGALCYSPAYPADKLAYNGAIFQLTSDGSTTMVSNGFRNPIAMRCESNHPVCLVAELARDGSGSEGGREKLVPVRQGDNWGYPCCATHNVPYGGVEYQDTGSTNIDCSSVTQEGVSFEIGHTPFGLDFETDAWATPWKGRVFVTLHGDVGSWQGARVVAVALDSTTGLPLPASELGGAGPNNLMDFATGWDDGTRQHGRPAAVTFAPDGRMFIGNDITGDIFWVAPVTLARPVAK